MIRIGITTYIDQINHRNRNMIGVDYIQSILKAGALPILIPLTNDQSVLDQYIQLIDGLMLTGGDDVNPLRYSEQNGGLSKYTSDMRDQQEFYLITEALKRKYPILGICRGLQILNVHFGGTLYQDIMTQFDTNIDHQNHESNINEIHHEVIIAKNTHLHRIYKQDTIFVNSRHHQAIKDVGRGFSVAARSNDGIIEAIESEENRILAVQWHPENLIELGTSYLAIFKAFIQQIKDVLKH